MNRQVIDCADGGSRLVPLTAAEIAARVNGDAPTHPLPRAVTRLQLVRALRIAGLKAAFDSVLAAAPFEMQEDWSMAVTVRRGDPLVMAFAGMRGLSEAALDEVFRQAAGL